MDTSRGVASNPEQGYTSSGAAIKSTIMEIILRKKYKIPPGFGPLKYDEFVSFLVSAIILSSLL